MEVTKWTFVRRNKIKVKDIQEKFQVVKAWFEKQKNNKKIQKQANKQENLLSNYKVETIHYPSSSSPFTPSVAMPALKRSSIQLWEKEKRLVKSPHQHLIKQPTKQLCRK